MVATGENLRDAKESENAILKRMKEGKILKNISFNAEQMSWILISAMPTN